MPTPVPLDAAAGASAGPPAVARRPRRPRGRWLSLLTVATLLLGWELITRAGLIAPLFLPAPEAVLAKLVTVARDGFVDATLVEHLGASLGRVGLALVCALVTAIPVGLALGLSPLARGVLDPLIEFYRPIPPLAYLPLIVIWFGIGELSKVLLIHLAIFAPVAISTAAGVARAAPDRVLAARALGASRWQVIRHVIVPGALPDILTGIRLGLGVGWSTLVAAELVAATRGLGFMVQSAAQFLVTDVVVLGILVIAAIACTLDLAVRRLAARLAPWQGRG